ncbi:MAG TPA: NAD-binding protein [Gammaproteobacteria bacterium]|nr:NAD-binding protein [Gammaproteobacteria bacterium]
MRAVFIGANSLTVMTARVLLNRGVEVVIIERDKELIDGLTGELDAGFVHGEGSKPAILRETDPHHTDFLFCLTASDQANIIASLVGRSLGFSRVVTKIEDPAFEHICIELGLEDTIIPTRTIGRFLADMVAGQDPLELSTMVKDEARVFSFVAHGEDVGPIQELGLPEKSRVICLYRDNKFVLPEDDAKLQDGDEVVILTHSRNLPALHERWSARESGRPAH